MLREFKHVKQEPGPGKRRWWGGDGLELTAWFDDEEQLTGFQLCYRDRALTWNTNGYWSHVTVGNGINEDAGRVGYSVAVLQVNGAPLRPPKQLVAQFEQASSTLADALRDTVSRTIRTLAA